MPRVPKRTIKDVGKGVGGFLALPPDHKKLFMEGYRFMVDALEPSRPLAMYPQHNDKGQQEKICKMFKTAYTRNVHKNPFLAGKYYAEYVLQKAQYDSL